MLINYREKIDTECSAGILEKRAIKVDGKGSGLKISLNLGNVKSCDYIRLNKHKNVVLFIEITDIKKSHQKLVSQNKLIDPVKSSLSAQTLRRVTPDSIIVDELKAKFLGTLAIYSAVESKHTLKSRIKRGYVVALCVDNIADVRVFLKLKNQLKSDLGALAVSVEFLPAHALVSLF